MDPKVQVAVNGLIQQCMLMAAKAHQWHLATRSYAAHVALNELYDYLPDAADKLSETCQGAGLNPLAITDKVTITFSSPDQAIKEIEAFMVEIEAVRKTVTDMPWLDNIFQDIQGTIYGTLYKLKRLS
ncbi:MAG: hypothetical protein K9K68_02920 [Methylococcaceae bacterium]|nr:hypothetical protein [Methylococcaceae bacterium]